MIEDTFVSSRVAPKVERYGRGSLTRVGDVNVLCVSGSFYEMGYQHGKLLQKEIAEGPIPYFRDFAMKLMGKSGLGPIAPLAWTAIQESLGRRVAKAMPAFAHETIRGLADGSGLDHAMLLGGCTMPDSILWITARMMRYFGHGPAVAHRLALGLGCTSALAWGDATKDGAMLHARNLDYHGVDTWPKTKTVIFHAPENGQRYVSVAAAGVALGGVTSMNEAGLTLTVHQHMFTDRTALGGTPIGVVGDIVMRNAESLDDAQKILEEHTPIGCWTYLIADGKRRETLCYEENPERRAARRITSGTFGYANIYLDEELGSSEVNLYGSYWRHNLGRQQRVNALLEEKKGTIDPQAMAEMVGDTGATDCRIRDSIAMVMTVASVVFRPEDGTLWIGTGDAPTSHGTFVPFSLGKMGHAPERASLHVEKGDAASRDAFEAFRKAYVAYLDRSDAKAAHGHAIRATQHAGDQSVYFMLRGLLAIEIGDARDAERSFDRALELGHPDVERISALHLWRGRARDLNGSRERAIADYRLSLARVADAPVHAAAKRGLRKPFIARAARKINIDVALGDVIRP